MAFIKNEIYLANFVFFINVFGAGTMFLLFLSIIVSIIAIWFMFPRIRKRSQYAKMGREWHNLLQKHPHFSAKGTGYPLDVEFRYAGPEDENLRKLRETFDLDSIAGEGSEVERIINLMTWVYQLSGHENEPEFPEELNAITFIRKATDEGMQLNCYMKTVILNEVYLSMGITSRHTHLLPHSNEEQESHFVTSVYSKELRKWILMDPDFGLYLIDEKHSILGVSEIRERLITGDTLNLMHVGRSRFEEVRLKLSNFILGVSYPWFLSAFIFKIRCPRVSTFGQDNLPAREYYELIPDGYNAYHLHEPTTTARGNKIFYMNDERQFWSNVN